MWRNLRRKERHRDGDVMSASGLDEARRERERSEERLRDAQVTVLIPLAELRAENHIEGLIQQAFQRRPKEER